MRGGEQPTGRSILSFWRDESDVCGQGAATAASLSHVPLYPAEI